MAAPSRLRRSRLLVGLLVCGLSAPAASWAQVTVGYSNPIFSSAASGRTDFQGRRATRLFEVSGLNAEPIDGSRVYDATTIWRLVDPSQPSSLSVTNLDPLLEQRVRLTRRDDVRVQRTEAVYATVGGVLTTTLPDDQRGFLRPRELGLPDQLLTVFPDQLEPVPPAPDN